MSPVPESSVELSSALNRTERHLIEADYRGYDPYDALHSPLARAPFVRNSHLLRWGFQQVLKRIPIQLRPLLGIHRGRNPVTLGLAIQGMAERDAGSTDEAPGHRDRIEALIQELSQCRSEGFSGACWGYDFDWESRYALIPAGYPTVVATGFITNALHRAWEVHRLEQARDLCISAARFVLEDLHRTETPDGFCWSYSPSDQQAVLNATMKGARLLVQAAHLSGRDEWLDVVRDTVRFVVAHQREDGSWPYSIGDSRTWSDHFHTGYVLDCLQEIMLGLNTADLAAPLDRGLAFYLDNFFTDDGAPKYYNSRVFPIDSTSCGQALLTLCRFGRVEQALRVASWAVRHLGLDDGTFKYQIHRFYQNRIPYTRWSTAWMYLGLATLERCAHLDQHDSASD